MLADNVTHNLSCQIRADDNSSTCIFTTVVCHIYIYDEKVSRIDGASVAIILCLRVLIVRRILLILDTLVIFSDYGCYKNISNSVNNCI